MESCPSHLQRLRAGGDKLAGLWPSLYCQGALAQTWLGHPWAAQARFQGIGWHRWWPKRKPPEIPSLEQVGDLLQCPLPARTHVAAESRVQNPRTSDGLLLTTARICPAASSHPASGRTQRTRCISHRTDDTFTSSCAGGMSCSKLHIPNDKFRPGWVSCLPGPKISCQQLEQYQYVSNYRHSLRARMPGSQVPCHSLLGFDGRPTHRPRNCPRYSYKTRTWPTNWTENHFPILPGPASSQFRHP